MNRKAESAALEFLTTYGWAFLVVLVAIGALVYFGIFQVSGVLTPAYCDKLLSPGFKILPKDTDYKDYYIKYDETIIPFQSWKSQEGPVFVPENDNAYFIISNQTGYSILICSPESQLSES